MTGKKEIQTIKGSDFNDNVRLQDFLKGELEILPLRTLDDFLLASAKFQIPKFKNTERWLHRVSDNLFYYQTNYFLTGIFIFIYFLFMYTTKLMYGMMLTYNIIRLLPWIRNIGNVKVPELIAICISIFILHYLEFSITYAVNSLMLFWMSISTIIFVTLVHASLRLRNFNNKVVNFLEKRGKRTPMTVLIYTSISYLFNNVVVPLVKNIPEEEQELLPREYYKYKEH